MRKRFKLNHHHYHHMYDPEMTEMLGLLHLGLVSQTDFIQARIRDDVRTWLNQYPRDSWEIQHIVDRPKGIMLSSDYWLLTDDDELATLFKLTWM